MNAPPDHLTPLDGTFLELEDEDNAAHMHIGALMVFGKRPGAATPSLDEVRSFLDSRLGALPRYRQRLAGPTAGGLGWQRWIDDEHFDVARHVREATLHRPGGLDELLEWAGDYFSLRLDRSMPLLGGHRPRRNGGRSLGAGDQDAPLPRRRRRSRRRRAPAARRGRRGARGVARRRRRGAFAIRLRPAPGPVPAGRSGGRGAARRNPPGRARPADRRPRRAAGARRDPGVRPRRASTTRSARAAAPARSRSSSTISARSGAPSAARSTTSSSPPCRRVFAIC